MIACSAENAGTWTAPAINAVTLPVWDPLDTGVLCWPLTGFLPAPLDTTRTYAYWRLEIADPTNPPGYLEVGVPYVGALYDHGEGPEHVALLPRWRLTPDPTGYADDYQNETRTRAIRCGATGLVPSDGGYNAERARVA